MILKELVDLNDYICGLMFNYSNSTYDNIDNLKHIALYDHFFPLDNTLYMLWNGTK